ncbi:coiled-coil domain-containing protein 134 [Trichonephila inaurata madagascariensis]|uniref:Coiled-coil domain-containing protein 134 n=1 Tax=Trichonephila inaurata madagascariensis TaxID=2747483 RepID=A0A8X6KGG4_9ARAC|nr:coiled-coil domain-containing protein 134 [Trichonephila inaurata madagascariensis]
MVFCSFANFYIFILLGIIYEVFCDSQTQTATPEFDPVGKPEKLKMTRENLFKAAFLEARLHQKDAIKSVLRFENYEKQYKITGKALEKIFEVVSAGKVIVENSDYIPGSDLPSNETVAAALSQIVDNTAMFGDFQLKLPDVTDRIMKNHPEWLVLMKWAIGFSNSTGIYDPKTTEMIDLLCQEMNLIERKSNFINPYRKYDEKITTPSSNNNVQPKQKKMNIKKGPRMSKPRRTEL